MFGVGESHPSPPATTTIVFNSLYTYVFAYIVTSRNMIILCLLLALFSRLIYYFILSGSTVPSISIDIALMLSNRKVQDVRESSHIRFHESILVAVSSTYPTTPNHQAVHQQVTANQHSSTFGTSSAGASTTTPATTLPDFRGLHPSKWFAQTFTPSMDQQLYPLENVT